MKDPEEDQVTKSTSILYFRLWLFAVLLCIVIVAAVSAAWAVRHVTLDGGKRFSERQINAVLEFSEFPHTIFYAVRELRDLVLGDPPRLLISREVVEKPHWVRSFPSADDPGYLLFSGVDPARKRSTVQLIRLFDGAVLAKWQPDWAAVYSQITSKKFFPAGTPNSAQARHPLLLDDGDIIFNTFSSLVRLGPCSSKPVWVLDEPMHHSIEFDLERMGVWVPSNSRDGFEDNIWLRERVQDDALAKVSLDGKLIQKISFSRILRKNGLEAMLLGRFGFRQNEEPVHMNQITVAPSDSLYWQKGDLLISARHLSTVFLYRPSTEAIIWYKTGPWLNQHAAYFIDDHRISVFDNAVIGGVPNDYAFIPLNGHNRVVVYDFADDQTSEPFADLLAMAKPVTITEGLARVLPDGGLFLEETNHGRTLRFAKDRLMWSHVNDYDGERIGTIHWSRYLTADEVEIPLQALKLKQCKSEIGDR